MDRVADEWRDLCGASALDQPFYRPEWIRAHVRTFSPGAKVVLIAARLDGRLCLVLPLLEEWGTYSKVPIRRLRAPTNCHGGRFDGVRRSGPIGDEAIRATWQFLAQLEGWDVLHMSNVPEESTVTRLAAEAQLNGFHTIRVPDRPNPYISADPESLSKLPLSPKLRIKLRQVRRKLAQYGSAQLRRVETYDRDALDRFYQMDASGWKGEEGTAILRNGSQPFYDEMAESAAQFGYFSLYLLELNGEIMAGHFSFTYRKRCYSPITSYNEKFAGYGPGHLMVSEILQDCAARGVEGFDITGQDQPWKMMWTSEARPVNGFLVFKGTLGNLAYEVGNRLRPAVSRFLHRTRKSA